MIKILFVCHGNICNSPMAEYMMKDMVKYRQLDDKYFIDSAATSDEYVGQEIHDGAKAKLDAVEVPYDEHHKARKLTNQDYYDFDYIVAMNDNNKKEFTDIFKSDPEGKVYKLLEFTGKEKDIPDSGITNDFDNTYDDMLVGISGLLKKMQERA